MALFFRPAPLFCVCLLTPGIFTPALAADVQVMTQRLVLSATAVASACRVTVEADGMGNNRLSLGVYSKSLGTEVPARTFTLWLYEEGATVPGCSAFLVAPLANVLFGNPGQLDDGGVVTRGAGDGVRIDVRATDSQADYRGRLTQQSNNVNYPAAFAASGKLGFQAKPVNVEQAKPGEYRGTLSFVVSYQ